MAYKLQQIVWAKLVGYPRWPAVIINEWEEDLGKSPEKSEREFYPVRFFGEHTTAWLELKKISDYEKNKKKYLKAPKTLSFLKAINEADDHLQKQKQDSGYHINFNISKSKKRKRPSVKNTPVKIAKTRASIADEDTEDTGYDLKETYNIGVIGMGLVGEEITKHFIKSGRTVNISNRRIKKCRKLKRTLDQTKNIKIMITPRAVLLKSDIIFVCLSDDEVTKHVIEWEFEAASETENMLEGKCILVMTRIKPESSVIFSDRIKSKGGKYLELAFQGHRKEIKEGTITLYTAGDQSLFNICQPFFEMISKASYYFGAAGNGIKINLIVQMIKGVSLGAFSEGMSLVERLGIPPKIFLEIFNETDMSCTYLRNKGNLIIESTYGNTEQPLHQMQTDLKNILEISEQVQQRVLLANMAHEIYKDCIRVQYGQDDVSAIIVKHKFY
ncbi:cytokine-like nuclear factor N-PAC [Diorhabda carinulata]|uniref:cytokine-like nuclear factor N-PAC n=1 Tax=Diorhabda carinulata TaxID=1163345 RepID=UPI0025A1379F|nr:cytokine-like nuclear factor N-PAC [Diorhabda carinulata]